MALRATLTRRYAVALALVAGVLLGSHALVLRHAATGAEDGAAINRAGMQRMLSQRIALLAGELGGATDPVVAARLAESLESAAKRMADNHAVLSARALPGGTARAVLTDPEALYAGGDRLGERVLELVSMADTLAARHRTGGPGPVRDEALSRRIRSHVLAGLLEDLDAVVQRHEAAFELGTRDALRLQALLLLAALIVLACEAGLIFRPMVARIIDVVTSLERANGRLREFTYVLSHDLRAPIASSRGLVGIMNESLAEGDVEDARELGALLDGSLLKMDVLIDDLTELVRLGEFDVPPEPVDLRALVDEVIESLSSMPGAEAVRMDTDVTFDAPVATQRVHLRSALENLVSNAIKYADPDEPIPYLKLSVVRRGRRVRIEVSDNGLGIPEPFRPQVFEMFKRFHPRVSTGSGLGLHLVQLSMQAIGGRIDYEALPDGSRFSLAFEDGGGLPA